MRLPIVCVCVWIDICVSYSVCLLQLVTSHWRLAVTYIRVSIVLLRSPRVSYTCKQRDDGDEKEKGKNEKKREGSETARNSTWTLLLWIAGAAITPSAYICTH